MLFDDAYDITIYPVYRDYMDTPVIAFLWTFKTLTGEPVVL